MQKRQFANLSDKVFLLGIGAQKAGTTWLSRYLAAHPQMALSKIKELHVWDQYMEPGLNFAAPQRAIDRFRRELASLLDGSSIAIGEHGSKRGESNLRQGLDIERLGALSDRIRMMSDTYCYLEYFDRLCTRAKPRAVGEITPEYAALSPRVLSSVKAFLEPHVRRFRIVFIMRDPVERVWAHLRHDTARGRAALASQTWRQRLGGGQELRLSQYDQTCSNIEQVFANTEVLYLFFEDLFSEITLRRLCDFLGLDFMAVSAEFFIKKIKRGMTDPIPKDFILETRKLLDPTYEFVRARFSGSAPKQWHW